MKQDKRRKSRGFTLGQMVTTVAIIGTVTAIAIPNYLRMRMNTNMEMVKQQLKVIGEEMTELMGKTGKFVDETVWGNDPSELGQEITANLNGISSKGYTTNQYSTDLNRSWYQFRTCPQNGKWGVSGDKCFLLESTGVKEVQLWEGWYAPDFVEGGRVGCGNCPAFDFLKNTPLPPSEQYMLDWFLYHTAKAKDYFDRYYAGNPAYEGMDPFTALAYSDQALQVMMEWLNKPSFYQKLVAEGVEASYFLAQGQQTTWYLTNGGYPEVRALGWHLDPSFDKNAHLTYPFVCESQFGQCI